MSRKKIGLICAVILVVAIVIIGLIFITEPSAKSEGATRESAMLVSVEEVEQGDFEPTLVATGTVQPVEDVMLSPLVSGQVLKRDENFVPGGFVEKGAVLLQIDPADYRNTLELRKSDLAQAKTQLDREMGRQKIAQQDLNLIGGDSLSENQKSLVLRQPQLNAVKATIKSAQASVNQAQLNLQRTTLRAPFDAHIINQNVTVGSQVAPGDDLGRLVGTDYYWVRVTLPVNKLKWLSFPPSEEQKGAMVKIKNKTAWAEDAFRTGYLYRKIGALDDQTRLARVLIRVDHPLQTEGENSAKPELIIGSFVEAHIQAKKLRNVVRVNRDYIRSNQSVWVMEDGKLAIKKVSIALTDAKYAYINKGLEHQDKVVTTNISTVSNGVRLRTEKQKQPQKDQNRQIPK